MPRGASRALYAGNGQAVEFPFLFKVFEEDQLSVLLTSPAGVTTEAAGWTAELDDGGGTVRYLHNGAPLPEGWKLAIMRDMPFVQEVDLITGTRFDPEVIETALDVATAERQQLLERLARAVVVEPTDEAGPEALLADIRDARTSAAASATSAQANANAAAESARSAAGSAAIATEEREAACICAGEAKDARDVALAQAEAANTLREAELAKVNALVAANRTDQEAAVTAARQWAEKEADVPVEYDEEGNPRYSARHWAENAQKIAIEPPTAERRGAIRVGAGLHLTAGENGETDVLAVNPDGVTTALNEDCLLSALGGNLLLNSELWITESGTFTAPVTGLCELFLIGGGCGASFSKDTTATNVAGGRSGNYLSKLIYLIKGTQVPVTIGSGGISNGATEGGITAFGDISTASGAYLAGCNNIAPANYNAKAYGGGFGGGSPGGSGLFYGAGGGANASSAGNGKQGAIRFRYHDPSKAAGSPAEPALFSARRMVARAADTPATVNLYDPETGQGSVWKAEDAETVMQERGLISQEAWQEICAAKAAEEYAAWLASPETEAERFELLRAARDAKLAEHDIQVAQLQRQARAGSDVADDLAAWDAYAVALCDLPAQEGAPWDGGGVLTPWPEMPAVTKVQEA